MSQQTIAIGSSANDGTGDTLRSAGEKINENFTELYSFLYKVPTTYVTSSGVTIDSTAMSWVFSLSSTATYTVSTADAGGMRFFSNVGTATVNLTLSGTTASRDNLSLPANSGCIVVYTTAAGWCVVSSHGSITVS